MDNYLLFVGVAVAPFVCLDRRSYFTLINSHSKGCLKTLAGISGCALGILLVATIRATKFGHLF